MSSQAWQREVAESVIAGHGEIAEEFVDVGWSREVAWERRPRAAALLAAARNPGRRFDAIVVGEYEGGSPLDSFCGWPSSWSVTACGCGCRRPNKRTRRNEDESAGIATHLGFAPHSHCGRS